MHQLANKDRFDTMQEFFGDIGQGHASGVWDEVPKDRPDFKARCSPPFRKSGKKA
jgi:chlorophyllide a reductase subunit Y